MSARYGWIRSSTTPARLVLSFCRHSCPVGRNSKVMSTSACPHHRTCSMRAWKAPLPFSTGWRQPAPLEPLPTQCKERAERVCDMKHSHPGETPRWQPHSRLHGLCPSFCQLRPLHPMAARTATPPYGAFYSYPNSSSTPFTSHNLPMAKSQKLVR